MKDEVHWQYDSPNDDATPIPSLSFVLICHLVPLTLARVEGRNHAPCARPRGTYRRKIVATISFFLTYLGGIVLKTKMYESTSAGKRQGTARNSTTIPRAPRDSEAANETTIPRTAKRARCHQTGTTGIPQNGHLSRGGLLPKGLILRSSEQFGHADQLLFFLPGAWAVVSSLHSITRAHQLVIVLSKVEGEERPRAAG